MNYEWLLDNEIPDGYSTSDAFLDVEQTTTEKTRALLEDDSLESHEAKLVQDFYHAWLDWTGEMPRHGAFDQPPGGCGEH